MGTLTTFLPITNSIVSASSPWFNSNIIPSVISFNFASSSAAFLSSSSSSLDIVAVILLHSKVKYHVSSSSYSFLFSIKKLNWNFVVNSSHSSSIAKTRVHVVQGLSSSYGRISSFSCSMIFALCNRIVLSKNFKTMSSPSFVIERRMASVNKSNSTSSGRCSAALSFLQRFLYLQHDLVLLSFPDILFHLYFDQLFYQLYMVLKEFHH